MDLGLAGRRYLVTGGTKGLGLATAKALAEDGARVFVSSRSADNLAAALAELGPTARGAVADNGDPAALAALVDGAAGELGGLDGLLVSVGGPKRGWFGDVTDEDWHAAFDTVFLGAVRLVRLVLPMLTEGAAIGLVLSSSVRAPIAALTMSNAFRPGLAMLVKQLGDELGPRGIRVLGFVPGRIATERTLEVDGGDPEAAARSAALIPLGRLGRPDEFGRVAAFALSPAASYLTGSMLVVDGGAIRSV